MNSLEALNYLEDIAYGRKMKYEPHDLKLIVKKSLEIFDLVKSACHIVCCDFEMSIYINGTCMIFINKKEYETYKEILREKN